MAKLTDADLAAILKRPGYAVRDALTAASPPPPKHKPQSKGTSDLRVALALRAASGEIEPIFKLKVMDEWLLHGMAREPHYEFIAIPGRKYRLDVAFPSWKAEGALDGGFGFEVQGNVHRIKAQFYRDMERHNTLTEAGWTMFYVGRPHIKDGSALELVRRVICG